MPSVSVPGRNGKSVSEEKLLLSEQIRKSLADEITCGVLRPGEQLDEQHLADRFGASRTPVREALRQLAVSGLLEMRPRRGMIVAQVPSEMIMNMFEMTAEIEAMCVRLATWRMTPHERGRLQQLHDASKAMVEQGDIEAYDAFNKEFHMRLYRATHNAFMAEQATDLRTRLAAFRRTQLRQEGRLARSRAEHDAIMTAISRGDGEEAARQMRAHLFNASSALDGFLAARSGSENVPSLYPADFSHKPETIHDRRMG
jgi:DNA-binding GntR family transcriptional regulator